jgi:hypothetical protein
MVSSARTLARLKRRSLPTDDRDQGGVFGKAEVLVDKAKQFLAKCFFKMILTCLAP